MSPQHSRRLIAAALLLVVLVVGCCAPMVNASLRGWASDVGLTCGSASFCAAAQRGLMR